MISHKALNGLKVLKRLIIKDVVCGVKLRILEQGFLEQRFLEQGVKILGVRISKCLTLDQLNSAISKTFLLSLLFVPKTLAPQKSLPRISLYQIVNNLGGLIWEIDDHFFIVLYPVIQMSGKLIVDLINHRHAQF